MKLFRIAFVCVIVILVSSFVPLNVYALSESQLDFFSQNGIYYYDPDGNYCGETAIGSFDGNSSAGLSDLQAAFVDTYHEIAESLSITYGIPWEAVMAQGILESAAGTSTFAISRNNFFGIGAFDSNPNNAYSFDTPEDGWRGYYENIKNTATYRNHGVFSGDTITNPYAYVQAVKNAGYATDPNYVAKLNTLIGAIENRANERGWEASAQLAVSHPVMLENAAANADGSNTTADNSSYSTCIYPAGNGDINETAINLSWPDRLHDPTDPKPSYKIALEADNGVATRGEGDVCSIGGYSCDAFLATVMRYSNADVNFPCCGAAEQLRYLIDHDDLYEEIPNIGNTSNLQPGDIRASESHVEIVVRLEDGSYKIASASHCDRTADHYINYYSDSSYRIFRKK